MLENTLFVMKAKSISEQVHDEFPDLSNLGSRREIIRASDNCVALKDLFTTLEAVFRLEQRGLHVDKSEWTKLLDLVYSFQDDDNVIGKLSHIDMVLVHCLPVD